MHNKDRIKIVVAEGTRTTPTWVHTWHTSKMFGWLWVCGVCVGRWGGEGRDMVWSNFRPVTEQYKIQKVIK